MLLREIHKHGGEYMNIYGLHMHKKRANLNDCAVPFLSSAAVNFCWYYVQG